MCIIVYILLSFFHNFRMARKMQMHRHTAMIITEATTDYNGIVENRENIMLSSIEIKSIRYLLTMKR